MATNDVPTFEGAEPERGKAMAVRLKEAGVSTVSELSALFGARVTFDGEIGAIDYVGADGKFRVTLASGRQPYGRVEALQPDGDGFTYTTPKAEG